MNNINDGTANFKVVDKRWLSLLEPYTRSGDALGKSLWNMFHRYGDNYKPSDTSNKGWNSLGLCIIYYTKDHTIVNQPTTYGQLINIPAKLSGDSTQIWIEQPGGRVWYRAGNSSISINDTPFKAVANTDEVNRVKDEVNSALDNLRGNHTPVITDIFDRAGTIDLSDMRDSDKASEKAKINKARNSIQNIWDASYGIYAYGGGLGMQNSYPRGTIKLTQSYKDFDKILIVACNDDGKVLVYKVWDVWELAFAFANSYRFCILGMSSIYWFIYGDTYRGTVTNYKLSTDTIWCCSDENSGIIGIYGIKY